MVDTTYDIKIFEIDENNLFELDNKYSLRVYQREDYHYKKPFDLIEYSNKITILNYKIIGSKDNDNFNVEVKYKDKPFYFEEENTNTIDLRLYNNLEDYEFYIDGKLTKVSSDIKYGFINGIVDVQKCNVSEEFLFIKCFRRYDHLFIGEYKVTAGAYTIPNLDVNEEYDIVLFDKSMTLEQQVSSKRIPRPY